MLLHDKVYSLGKFGSGPRRHFDAFSVEGLFDDAESFIKEDEHKELIQCIYCLAVAAPSQFERDFYEGYRKFFTHQNDGVRLAAIGGVGYLEWIEFKPDLLCLREEDDSSSVRSSAEVMVRGIEELLE